VTVLTLTHEDRVEAVALLAQVRMYLTRGWTTHALARDMHGEYVDPRSAAAVCWCLGGALCAAAGLSYLADLDRETTRAAWIAEYAIEKAAGPVDAMETFNDAAMSVEEVVTVVDLAQTLLTEEMI